MTASAEGAVFRPVHGGNAFEETVERLVQSIRLGVVGAGDQLPPERELAVRLGVSRATLRESIRALQEAGYVTSRRGRYGGTFVNRRVPGTEPAPALDPGALDDILVMRNVLEVGAAAAAVGTADLVARQAETASAPLPEYRMRDSRLHLAIAAATGSASLVSAVADVRTRLNGMLDAIPLLPRNIEHSNHQHAAIVDAIVRGDGDAARTAMAEHLDGTAALLRGFLS